MGPTAQDFRAAFGLGDFPLGSTPSTPTAWPGGVRARGGPRWMDDCPGQSMATARSTPAAGVAEVDTRPRASRRRVWRRGPCRGLGSVALGRSARNGNGLIMFADRSSAPSSRTRPRVRGPVSPAASTSTPTADLSSGGSPRRRVAQLVGGRCPHVNAKENFRDVAGEEVLDEAGARFRIRAVERTRSQDHLPSATWGRRHEDVRAALRAGRLSAADQHLIDADGVALAGVQALEARTRARRGRRSKSCASASTP